MSRRRSELSARGYVYCLVWESEPGARFTRKGIQREALARIGRDKDARRALETLVTIPSTVYRPLLVLELSRIVKRDTRARGSNGEVVWIRQETPKAFSTDLLVVRGAPREAVDEMMRVLEQDKLVELHEDGLWRDTRAA